MKTAKELEKDLEQYRELRNRQEKKIEDLAIEINALTREMDVAQAMRDEFTEAIDEILIALDEIKYEANEMFDNFIEAREVLDGRC